MSSKKHNRPISWDGPNGTAHLIFELEIIDGARWFRLIDDRGAALRFSLQQCITMVDLLFKLFDPWTTLPITQNDITLSREADNLLITISGTSNLTVPIDGIDAVLSALADASHNTRPIPTWKNAPRHMGLWSKSEERELLKRLNRGEDIKRIALELGRSMNAVEWRLGRLRKPQSSK